MLNQGPAKELSTSVDDVNYHRIYQHRRIRLDGKEFHQCEFHHCTLLYGGGDLPSLVGCEFHACGWEFIGAARNAVLFMQALYGAGGDGGKELMERTFDTIRGKVPQAGEGGNG